MIAVTVPVPDFNQYTAVGSATPTYNGDGGLATFRGNTYTYDALGKLTEVANSSGMTLFSYDPCGRRVKKVDENLSGTVLATYQYHYDGSSVAVEYRPEDTWTYYQGVMRTDGTNNQYYYHDAQGSVSAVADNSGNVLEAYEYTAQGHFQITNGSGTVLTSTGIGNDLLYTGQRYDAETGNYYDNARYYNPGLGRFLNRDPLPDAEFSQGTNLYAYCGNDYVNGIDPSGMGQDQPVYLSYGGPAIPNPAGGHYARTNLGPVMGILPGWYIFVPAPSAQVNQGGPSVTAQPAVVSASPSNQPQGTRSMDFESYLDDAQSALLAAGSFAIFPEGGAANGARLVRFGKNAESVEKLAADAARAAENGFPFGVSTMLRSSGFGNARTALMSDVEDVFNVIQTGSNPSHYTVELPNPVTQEAADIFNSLFK